MSQFYCAKYFIMVVNNIFNFFFQTYSGCIGHVMDSGSKRPIFYYGTCGIIDQGLVYVNDKILKQYDELGKILYETQNPIIIVLFLPFVCSHDCYALPIPPK